MKEGPKRSPSAKKKATPKSGGKNVRQMEFDWGEPELKPESEKEPVQDSENQEPDISPASEKRERNGKQVKRRGSTAQEMAGRQREISVSEFFTKNRHLLGFDNPRKALLTTIKEAVDNSLDACEEAGILPHISVEIVQVEENIFRVTVTDNGPGIVKPQIPKIFGKLLYGSKFHSLRQSRGQQGIGISAAGMYGQITTGKPVIITSKPSPRKPAHYYEVRIDTRKNAPDIVTDSEVEWEEVKTGTRVTIELDARYQRGKRSVDEYLAQTALANPHLTLTYKAPDSEPFVWERTAKELPPETLEIKPHPYGVELGTLMRMLKDSTARNLGTFFKQEFSRMTQRVVEDVLSKTALTEKTRPSRVSAAEAGELIKAIANTKIMAPPTNCIVPIGEELILKSLTQNVQAEFVTATTRPPSVYRGNPFIVEAGIAYGGDLPQDGLATLYRLANRVPLLYQQSACTISEQTVSIDWRSYRLQQSRGGLPQGPLVILVHLASVWVPFTSESKEAIADYPEINKEIRLALQECGRKLAIHLSRKRKEAEAERKRSYITKYIPHIAEALQQILHLEEARKEKVEGTLTEMLERSRKAGE